MVIPIKWLLLLTLTGIHAQEPRKRNSVRYSYEEPIVIQQSDDDVSCSVASCVKRSPGQDEFGPFWANRGKKDPVYSRSKLFAEEPHYILVPHDEKDNNDEPFFVTRGKKKFNESRKITLGQFWRNLLGPNASRKLHDLQNLGELSSIKEGKTTDF